VQIEWPNSLTLSHHYLNPKPPSPFFIHDEPKAVAPMRKERRRRRRRCGDGDDGTVWQRCEKNGDDGGSRFGAALEWF